MRVGHSPTQIYLTNPGNWTNDELASGACTHCATCVKHLCRTSLRYIPQITFKSITAERLCGLWTVWPCRSVTEELLGLTKPSKGCIIPVILNTCKVPLPNCLQCALLTLVTAPMFLGSLNTLHISDCHAKLLYFVHYTERIFVL